MWISANIFCYLKLNLSADQKPQQQKTYTHRNGRIQISQFVFLVFFSLFRRFEKDDKNIYISLLFAVNDDAISVCVCVLNGAAFIQWIVSIVIGRYANSENETNPWKWFICLSKKKAHTLASISNASTFCSITPKMFAKIWRIMASSANCFISLCDIRSWIWNSIDPFWVYLPCTCVWNAFSN